jgi:hypothetical protein
VGVQVNQRPGEHHQSACAVEPGRMNTYSHVAPEVSREAAERMARALWQDVGDDHAGEHSDGE